MPAGPALADHLRLIVAASGTGPHLDFTLKGRDDGPCHGRAGRLLGPTLPRLLAREPVTIDGAARRARVLFPAAHFERGGVHAALLCSPLAPREESGSIPRGMRTPATHNQASRPPLAEREGYSASRCQIMAPASAYVCPRASRRRV